MSLRSKKVILGSAAGILVVPLFIAAVSLAQAHDKDSLQHKMGEKSAYRQEIKAAVENGDYETWTELTQDKQIAGIIDSEALFDKLKQMHDLRQDGQHEEADEIRQELGLPDKKQRHQQRHEDRQQMMEALESGDYSAWQEAVKDHPKKADLSEEDFGKLVEAHTLKLEGKHDEAREIREQLGLHKGHHHN